MLGFTSHEWWVGIFFALVGAVLSLVVPWGLRIARTLPGTFKARIEASNESDAQAAQRLANNTQRLIVAAASFLMMGMAVLCFTGAVLLGWAMWSNYVPIWMGFLLGLLLGVAMTCWYAVRIFDRTSDILREEERQRYSSMN